MAKYLRNWSIKSVSDEVLTSLFFEIHKFKKLNIRTKHLQNFLLSKIKCWRTVSFNKTGFVLVDNSISLNNVLDQKSFNLYILIDFLLCFAIRTDNLVSLIFSATFYSMIIIKLSGLLDCKIYKPLNNVYLVYESIVYWKKVWYSDSINCYTNFGLSWDSVHFFFSIPYLFLSSPAPSPVQFSLFQDPI